MNPFAFDYILFIHFIVIMITIIYFIFHESHVGYYAEYHFILSK